MIEIALDTPYHVASEKNKIPPQAIKDVCRWLELQGQGLVAQWIEQQKRMENYYIWKVTEKVDGEPTGTWPKRMSSVLYKTAKHKLDKDLLSAIGEKLSKYDLVPTEEAVLVFSSEITWEQGAFGDTGSCWWGYNYKPRVRQLFDDNPHTLALKLYPTMDAYEAHPERGMGRAFFYKDDKKELLAMFNSKGLYNDSTAKLVGKVLGLNYSTCNVDIDVSYTDGMGTVFGNADKLPTRYVVPLGKEELQKKEAE